MPKKKAVGIQRSGLRRSPRFIQPNQLQSDTDVTNSESILDLGFESSQKSSIEKSRKLKRSKASKVKETNVSTKSVTESAPVKRKPARQNGAGEGCCFQRSTRSSSVKCFDKEKLKQEDLSKERDSSKRQNFEAKLDRQGGNVCVRTDDASKSRSRKRRKKVSERSEADESVAVSMVEEDLSKALITPKICANNSGRRVTRSTTRATVCKDEDLQIVASTMAEPTNSVDTKNFGDQVDKKRVGSKRKITSTIDVHPSVLERTTGLELTNTKAAEEKPMVRGWTKEQELALQGAYFSVKPTPHFWKKVAKMVPGKSAQECFEKINSDILTPSQPQRRSVSKRPSSLSFSLSPSILLTPSEPTSKKSRRGKGKQCSYKNVRHLINKQAKTELPKGGADLFSVFEPSFSLSTQPVQNAEVVSKGERSLAARINDHSGHGGCFNSPPVLKQIKNKALHEKYIDQLHTREAKRKVASKKATRCLRGKNDVKESQVLKEEAIGRAKSSLIVNARSAINQFLQSQSTITGDSDDGNDDFDDDIEEDDLENSL